MRKKNSQKEEKNETFDKPHTPRVDFFVYVCLFMFFLKK